MKETKIVLSLDQTVEHNLQPLYIKFKLITLNDKNYGETNYFFSSENCDLLTLSQMSHLEFS